MDRFFVRKTNKCYEMPCSWYENASACD